MSARSGFLFGVAVGACVIYFAAVLPILIWVVDARPVRVWRTDSGIVCKLDRYYPELDCRAVERAFGPRLSKLEVKR